MIDIEELKLLIVARLKPLNPDKIILFGSYAYGAPTVDSDIYLKYSKKLRDLQKVIPINLIVRTKQMYEKFQVLNSSFYRYSIFKGQPIW